MYSVRFRSWRFYAMLGFVLADFASPFVPLGAMLALGFMFIPRIENWTARFLIRALYGYEVGR